VGFRQVEGDEGLQNLFRPVGNQKGSASGIGELGHNGEHVS
jgi:hypothetical protein